MASDLGKWAFIIGAVLALLMGIGVGLGKAWGTEPWLVLLLVVLGLIVGFVNVSMKETQGFLLSAAALVIVGTAYLGRFDTLLSPLGTILAGMITNVLYVVAPAALVVALRAVYGYAAE